MLRPRAGGPRGRLLRELSRSSPRPTAEAMRDAVGDLTSRTSVAGRRSRRAPSASGRRAERARGAGAARGRARPGSADDRPAVGVRPGRRRPPGDAAPAVDLGHRTVRHVAGPSGLAGGARTRCVGGGPSSRRPARTVPETPGRRLEPRRRGTRPGVRWSSACSGEVVTAVFVGQRPDGARSARARCTRPAFGSRRTSASSVSTTSRRPRYFVPPLTTVRQDFAELGRSRRAADPRTALAGVQTPAPGGGRGRRSRGPGEHRPRASATSTGRSVVTVGAPSAGRGASTSAPCPDAPSSSGSATAPSSAAAVHEYAHGVVDRRAAATGQALPPDWALQMPDDWTRRAAAARCRSGRRRRRRPGTTSSGSAPTSPPAPCCRRSPTARRCASCRESRDRPHAYPKLWKHHAAQPHADRINAIAERARRAVAGAVRRPDLRRVGVRQGAAGARGGPGGLRRARTAGSRRPTGSSGSCAGSYVAQRLHRRLQGHLPGRRATRRADYLAALEPGVRRLRRRQARPPDRPARATRPARLTAEAAGWTGLPEGIAVCVGNVDAHVTAPAAQATEPGQMVAIMGTSTCHVMSVGRACARSPACAASSTAGSCPASGATRPARAASATSSAGSSTPASRPTYVVGGRRARPGRARVPHRRWPPQQAVGEHGLVALDWHSGNRSVLVDHDLSGVIVGQTLATRPEDIYRALHRGHRVRHPHDRRGVRGQRASRSPSSWSPVVC